MQVRQQIAVVAISTRKYKIFAQQLLDGLNKYFLLNHEIHFFLFTDEFIELISKRVWTSQHIIPDYKFPFATLYRFKIFSEHEYLFKEFDHIWYLDIDMSVESEITDEVLVEGLVAVRHPGFFKNNGWGDSGNPINSTSYMPVENRKHYYCGGTQSGTTDDYLHMCKVLSENIRVDEENGVIAEHNDETHYNKFINENTLMTVTELSPSYCIPQQPYLRKLWGIDDLPVKIIALEKNHSEIRS